MRPWMSWIKAGSSCSTGMGYLLLQNAIPLDQLDQRCDVLSTGSKELVGIPAPACLGRVRQHGPPGVAIIQVLPGGADVVDRITGHERYGSWPLAEPWASLRCEADPDEAEPDQGRVRETTDVRNRHVGG